MRKLIGFLLFISVAIGVNMCNHKLFEGDVFKTGKRVVEQQGYTDVTNEGYGSYCCDSKDLTSVGFSAKDKSGNMVRGCMCGGGGWKAVTIRWR